MDINSFCRNEDGSWNRTKEYEWHYRHINAEFDNGEYGEYAGRIATGDDTDLVTALLFEAGIKSEGEVKPLMTKKIFTDEYDTADVYGVIKNAVSDERYQELLTKYCGIKAEFQKRREAHHDATEAKYGDASKPKQKVRRFKIA